MQIQDHFLSKETFKLIEDSNVKGYWKTEPIPPKLENYYQSEAYFSHEVSNRSLFAKLYAWGRNVNRVLKFRSIKPFLLRGEQVLDYGCGIGDFAVYLSKKAYDVKASEPNEKAARIATKNLGKEVLYPNEVEEKIADTSLGTIMLWHVLEHVPDPKKLFSVLKKKLKKEGHLIIALPNHGSYDASFYKEYWAAWDVPRHLHHWNQQAIKEWAAGQGFKLIATKPLWLDAFYVTLLSEKYKQSGIWGKSRSFYKGLLSNILAVKSKEFSSLIYVFRKI